MKLQLRSMGMGISTISTALGLAACVGQVSLGHGTGTTRGALGEEPLASGACNTSLTACSNVCVDTTKDLLNCGACGTACGAQGACDNGQCTLSTAANEECDLTDIGAACSGGTTCIPATCCDDPNGCAPDPDAGINSAGSGSSGSSSSSGGVAGTGTSRACAICEAVGGTYCPPSQTGMACAGGGVCGQSGGGGGGPVTTPDGGTTMATYGFSTCGGNGSGSSSGAGSSSSGSPMPVGGSSGASSSSSGSPMPVGSTSSSSGSASGGSSSSSGGIVVEDAGAGSSSSSGG